MGLFLGKKAYQCAGEETNEKARNKRLNSVAKLIIKRVDTIDSTIRLKRKLMVGAEKIFEATKGRDISTKKLLYTLIWFCGSLLGFESNGRINAITHSLFYWQNKNQYITSNIIEGKDDMQEYKDKKYVFNIRKKIVKDLKAEGLTYYKISLIFNTTEYQVRKIINDI